jgi:GntR family transcriptional regulator
MTKDEQNFHIPPISPAAFGTLYEQIVEGIKKEVSEGRIKPGESLPSFRALAEQLLVSLITVKRAYEELERQGIIFRKQGLGTFISENGAVRNRELKKRNAALLMSRAVKEAADADMKREEILELAKKYILESKGEVKK